MGEPNQANDEAGQNAHRDPGHAPAPDHARQADRAVRKRVGIHQGLADRARRGQDDGGEAADQDATYPEQ